MKLHRGIAKPWTLPALALLIAGALYVIDRSAGDCCSCAPPAACIEEPATYNDDGGCIVYVPAPVPRYGILDAKGRAWNLEEMQPGTELFGADLRGAQWRGVCLEGVEFRGVDFRGADLGGANLRRCVFLGCDFRRANLEGVDLTGALYNGYRGRLTRWPAGFDPWVHGDPYGAVTLDE